MRAEKIRPGCSFLSYMMNTMYFIFHNAYSFFYKAFPAVFCHDRFLLQPTFPRLDAERWRVIQKILVKLLLIVRIRVFQVRERRDGKVTTETFSIRIELEWIKLDFLKPGFHQAFLVRFSRHVVVIDYQWSFACFNRPSQTITFLRRF